MKLGTYIAQGVLVTKMELWIPPSSSYVTNVTVRLRWKRLYGSMGHPGMPKWFLWAHVGFVDSFGGKWVSSIDETPWVVCADMFWCHNVI